MKDAKQPLLGDQDDDGDDGDDDGNAGVGYGEQEEEEEEEQGQVALEVMMGVHHANGVDDNEDGNAHKRVEQWPWPVMLLFRTLNLFGFWPGEELAPLRRRFDKKELSVSEVPFCHPVWVDRITEYHPYSMGRAVRAFTSRTRLDLLLPPGSSAPIRFLKLLYSLAVLLLTVFMTPAMYSGAAVPPTIRRMASTLFPVYVTVLMLTLYSISRKMLPRVLLGLVDAVGPHHPIVARLHWPVLGCWLIVIAVKVSTLIIGPAGYGVTVFEFWTVHMVGSVIPYMVGFLSLFVYAYFSMVLSMEVNNHLCGIDNVPTQPSQQPEWIRRVTVTHTVLAWRMQASSIMMTAIFAPWALINVSTLGYGIAAVLSDPTSLTHTGGMYAIVLNTFCLLVLLVPTAYVTSECQTIRQRFVAAQLQYSNMLGTNGSSQWDAEHHLSDPVALSHLILRQQQLTELGQTLDRQRLGLVLGGVSMTPKLVLRVVYVFLVTIAFLGNLHGLPTPAAPK